LVGFSRISRLKKEVPKNKTLVGEENNTQGAGFLAGGEKKNETKRHPKVGLRGITLKVILRWGGTTFDEGNSSGGLKKFGFQPTQKGMREGRLIRKKGTTHNRIKPTRGLRGCKTNNKKRRTKTDRNTTKRDSIFQTRLTKAPKREDNY